MGLHGGVVEKLRIALVVTSDAVKKGLKEDRVTPVAARIIEERGHELVYRAVAGNDEAEIQLHVLKAVVEAGADLVLVTGGTGPRPRDVSVDAVAAIASRELPGVGEEFRRRSMKETPYALLSRATCFILRGSLVAVSPGNPSAVRTMLELLLEVAGHAVYEARR